MSASGGVVSASGVSTSGGAVSAGVIGVLVLVGVQDLLDLIDDGRHDDLGIKDSSLNGIV